MCKVGYLTYFIIKVKRDRVETYAAENFFLQKNVDVHFGCCDYHAARWWGLNLSQQNWVTDAYTTLHSGIMRFTIQFCFGKGFYFIHCSFRALIDQIEVVKMLWYIPGKHVIWSRVSTDSQRPTDHLQKSNSNQRARLEHRIIYIFRLYEIICIHEDKYVRRWRRRKQLNF